MPVYTPQVKGISADYNDETMTYHIEVPFSETYAAINPAVAASALANGILTDFQVNPLDSNTLVLSAGAPATGYSTVPGKLIITASGPNCSGGTWGPQSVICFICNRRFEELGSSGTRTVIATYEGRVLGVHSCASRVQLAAMPIYQSLRPDIATGAPASATGWTNPSLDADGNALYTGIGADYSGTTRDVPLFVYSVMECVPLQPLTNAEDDHSDFYGRMDDWDELAGSVNEKGWIPPWDISNSLYLVNFSDPTQGVFEGAYLYLGTTETQVDKRTQTAMVRHDFMVNSARAHQGIYWFQNWEEMQIPGTDKLQRKYTGGIVPAWIQSVAGSDPDIITLVNNLLSSSPVPVSGLTLMGKWGALDYGFNAYGNFGSPMLEG